ncbi:hypothetical protein MLD38_000586 [Melastoma candidum]|uniref:Uncharacterized protein n=1 Tax=Melastoma candidum TaxID=119954 RepID=A0ACB9SB12_9MYRT|nr:hypothetical protein MLD38_000586 [Melastoma candidum]
MDRISHIGVYNQPPLCLLLLTLTRLNQIGRISPTPLPVFSLCLVYFVFVSSGVREEGEESSFGTLHKRKTRKMNDVDFFTEYGDANKYKILEVVGKGSYGVVCAAIDTHTGEKVAIKKIRDIFTHISDAVRILREVKLLRLLRHPDIVDIKSIMLPPSKREFKDIYVVFELMESDLHQVIKSNDDLTREHHQLFLYQMLRALKYMHTANVYHRDLKPKNILANANCKLKVCDFGLARVFFSDAPSTLFWTDYVATRWYRAPELCGSFYSKYTPAIDIWSIGCIFAEVLTGKPLFPGKTVIHQLDLITDLLGTPPPESISGVRNEKARRYLTRMRKKQPTPFTQRFPNADPAALRLLQRLLAFDAKDRPTAAEALADPYFKGLSKLEREPSCSLLSKSEFEFERRRVTKEDVRELLYQEILEYHPQLRKDYINGTAGSNFLYPSATGQFRRQIVHLEEHGARSAPVIPLERKHASLPRPSVHSRGLTANSQPNVTSRDSRQTYGETSTSRKASDAVLTSRTAAGPPPRVPNANSGGVVGPALSRDGGRWSIKDSPEGRDTCGSGEFPTQPLSQPIVNSPHGMIREKSLIKDVNGSQEKEPSTQCNDAVNPVSLMVIDVNPIQYFPPLDEVGQLNERLLATDAKVFQAQSQLEAVSAVSVAIAAHRNVGSACSGYLAH